MKRIICLMACLFVASANASVMRTIISEDAPGTNGSWSFGTIFTVGAQDLNVTSLGAYDYQQNGFGSSSIKVGIFDEASNSLLASANVLSSDALLGLYRYSDINLTLLAGQQYRLVGVNGNNDYYIQGNSTWSYTSDITVNGYGYCSTTALTSCADHTEGDYGMANFQYNTSVPAPAGLALLGLGLVGLGLNRRRKTA